jgi:hypothetical protein
MWRCLTMLLVACGSGAKEGEGGEHDTAVSVDTAAPTPTEPIETTTTTSACSVPGVALPDGLVELVNDDGVAGQTIHDVDWVYAGYTGTYETVKELQFEAARFELEHPAEVHAVSIRWANLKDDLPPSELLMAGVYPDFGHNGFDFDREAPLWEGGRCVEDFVEGEWLHYVLEEPVVVEHPGLVYVAHQRARKPDPAWWMTTSMRGDGTCATFDECAASWNFPELDAAYFYPGVTVPVPWDYLVRLHVRWTEELTDEDKAFEATELTLGKRSSWGDYDHDGDDDLMTAGLLLYRNDGGAFTDVTEVAGLSGLPGLGGGVWGDYDNDGCLDFFGASESTTGLDLLLRSNCDGTFSDVTVDSGIEDVQTAVDCVADVDEERANTAAAAWWDIDSDGLLDLYMANMICWDTWQFYGDRVWHNEGDGTFSDWTGTRGFDNVRTSGRGASPADADGDGDVDLMVNNYTLEPNQYFENQGDGSVVERAEEAGLRGDLAEGYFGHTIGSVWGDVDNDGLLDAVHANLAHPRYYDFSYRSKVILNNGDGTFRDHSLEAGLRYQETHSVPALADFDHDGDLDLVITAVYDGRPTDFYQGEGDGQFTLDAYRSGITTEDGWGVAVADADQDGDPDLAMDVLFLKRGSPEGAWLQVRAVGNVDSNWAAIGATVTVHAGVDRWVRHVQGGTGQGNQDSLTTHFGLGELLSVDRVVVSFPGGEAVDFAGPFDVDQRVWLYEDGTVSTGFAP